jgi:hypothetical protein
VDNSLRLPIEYDIPRSAIIQNAFYQRLGRFDNPYDEFVDICLENLTWAAYHLLQWRGKPLRLAPFQSVILETLWNKTFPILLGSRGASKTFMLAVYAAMRAMLTPGSKVVIVSAGFRQSKLVFDYIEQLYNGSPLFKACCVGGVSKQPDQVMLKVGDSVIRALPLGNGEKIRGLRATCILCDEMSSINPEILQVVVRGFAAVSADPIEAAARTHRERKELEAGIVSKMSKPQSNQIVYSGTSSFQFNHFYKLYTIHKTIIENKIVGSSLDVNARLSLFDEEALQHGHLDYNDYAIIQIPYYGLPESFMDEKQIAQARVTMPKALFSMEYECVFPTDSDGFFKRSIINMATPGHKACGGLPFPVEVNGTPGFEYVMGIDPARKTDNFAISILKLYPDTKTYRNVYCYSIKGKSWPVATKKVRELMKKFNIVRIAMDAGGGGNAVMDILQDPEKLQSGEQLIWDIGNEEHKNKPGLHILEMVNFSPTWIGPANYGMASDIEHRRLLFPMRTLDTTIGFTTEDDKEYDKEQLAHVEDVDNVWSEIADQIDETCMIVVTPTKTGVQHFDLPELPTSQQSTLKTYQRKDRYSALLLSCHAARQYFTEARDMIELPMGGWVYDL